MIRLKLTKAQTTKLQAAKPSDKAAFVMGYAQRHAWPAGEHWCFVVTFCDYPKATKAGQAIGLLDRTKRLKAAKKKATSHHNNQPTNQPTNQTMPAHKKFTKPLFLRILARFDAGQKTVPAIEAEGISTSTLYRHLEKDPELGTLYKAARDARDIPALEGEAYRRAVEGNLKPVYQGGVKVGEVREFSDSLLMFLLRARKPSVYAKPEVQVVNNNTIVNKKTEEQLETWRKSL